VGASGLEANPTEGRPSKLLEHLDVGDRELPFAGAARAAPEAVAAVLDQARFDAPRPRAPVGHGQVLALGEVALKDVMQPALGQLGLGEADEARGVLVDAVNDVEGRRGRPFALAAPGLPDEVERGAALPALEGHGGDARGLVDDHEVRVLEHDPKTGRHRQAPRVRARHVPGHPLADGQAARRIGLHLARHRHLARGDEVTRLSPGRARQAVAKRGGEGELAGGRELAAGVGRGGLQGWCSATERRR